MANSLSSSIASQTSTTDSMTETTSTTSTTSKAGVIGRYAPVVARFLLGAVFFVFGLNGFLNFIPPPPDGVPEGAMKLGMAMMETGYLFQFIKGTEVLCGLLLLCNRFVPLALVVLAPIVLNILAFHLFLASDGTGLSVVILALQLYLAWGYRQAFAPLLTARTAPAR
jgi:uncharacterized membrane protein YphA (DoxX/SURF4 family)